MAGVVLVALGVSFVGLLMVLIALRHPASIERPPSEPIIRLVPLGVLAVLGAILVGRTALWIDITGSHLVVWRLLLPSRVALADIRSVENSRDGILVTTTNGRTLQCVLSDDASERVRLQCGQLGVMVASNLQADSD